ncbi:MAG: TolC family protein [Polyangiales bacterium]
MSFSFSLSRRLTALSFLLVACVPHAERVAHDRFVERASAREDEALPSLDGSLDAYVAHALRASPSVDAAFERWRAAEARIGTRRRWPRPQLTYAALVRPVETRVGPQRQRVGARLPIAWPSQLRSGAQMGAALAQAEAERFEAELVRLRARVAEAYWPLWLLERRAETLDAELALLDGVAEGLRARLPTGQASLAHVQLVELRRARVADLRASLSPARRRFEASLRAAVGLDPNVAIPVAAATPSLDGLPNESELLAWAAARPDVRAHEALAQANEASEANAAARRWPDLALGVEWMETGPARMPNVAGDGDDAWMIGVTVGVPVDLGALDDERRAARAEAAAHRADGRANVLAATMEVQSALADLDDARRRVALHEEQLLPAAEGAWEATTGAFATSRASLADVLLAARELVELRFGLDEARVNFARAWARLEAAVGRAIDGVGERDREPAREGATERAGEAEPNEETPPSVEGEVAS